MATITLKYQKNQSHEIRVEDLKIEKVNNNWTVKEKANTTSFFMEEYKEAIEMVNDIKSSSKSKTGDESINNRILFVGQRGTGKTSAMTSFARALDNAELDNKNVFKHLPLIDPSNFDNNTNILLTVITMMFSEAKKMMKIDKNDEDIISIREDLLRKFDEVFKSLKAITGSDKPTYTLEGLNEKSRALQMRTGMHCLVKSYIEFYNKVNKTRLSHLVLLIDDIDMTVSHVPEMLEQLRKYLDLDNLLVLLSANLGQLYNEMREHYSKAFKETLNDRNQALSIDVEDLANKYLLKLFPTSRRVRVEHLVSQLIETDLKLIEVMKKENGTVEEKIIESGGLQNVVLSLIWQKTRLLFVPKDANTMLHPIIPTNLRELMQFLDMLVSLDEVSNAKYKLFTDAESYVNCEENIRKFKKYILHNWIPNHLSVEEELVFDNIPTDITEINKHLINSINVIGNQHKTRLMSREVGLDMIERNAEDVNIDRDIYTMVSPNDPKFVKANKISDIFNQPSNYSYGDLLLMIDKYETYFESEDDRKFTDAIKIYYSILLFETMFFKSTNVNYNKKPEVDADLNDLLIPIQKLIGGTVYYPNYFEIITDKHFNQEGPSFDAKRAFYHKLPVKDKVGKGYPFYAVLYYGDIRPDRYDTKHIYDTTFDHDAKIDGTDFVTFDILSILSNMLNPWHTYQRAGDKKVYEYSKWIGRIKGWGNNCVISGVEDTYIPNSILPFYSLDMMLQYLKRSQSSEKVSKTYNYKEINEIVTMRNEYSKVLFGAQDEKAIIWNYFVDNHKKNEDNDMSFSKLINLIEKGGKIEIDIAGEKPNLNGDDFMKIIKKEYAEKKSEIEVLLSNLFIISKIYLCFKKHNICPPLRGVRSIADPFKNFVMAVLLNHYRGGKKNLNTLIKDLNKCETISETYRLLVDYLWINAVNEALIRSKIQDSIRSNESVSRYYNILWSETAKMLSIIARPKQKEDIKYIPEKDWLRFLETQENDDDIRKMEKKLGNSDVIVSYLKLYMEAKKCFIDDNK